MKLWMGVFVLMELIAIGAIAEPVESGAQELEACEADAEIANLSFTLKDINGEDFALSDYAGKVILLDFWATWCVPCRIEIPGFIELFDKYESEGFIVLGVSVDGLDEPDVSLDETVTKLQAFAEELGMDYPILLGARRQDILDAYGPPYGFPTTFVIARDLRICGQHTGFATKETFEAEIRAALTDSGL